jgi:hypothetical protein
MQKTIWVFMFLAGSLVLAPGCNHNKIACPTYADSFPDAKKPAKPDAPKALPKASKSNVSHSMGPRLVSLAYFAPDVFFRSFLYVFQ